jgi:hypothetical protein
MNAKSLLSLSLAALCLASASSAFAYDSNADAATHKLTRAEVIADTIVWRKSGLAALEAENDSTPPIGTERYERAQAEYQRLRHSPEFAALVESIQAKRTQMASR